MRLAGKRLFISAAAQGMGRASALACAREGAEVVATDINADLLATLKDEAPGIETQVLDVRSGEAVAAFAQSQAPFDGIFNCAGFVHNGTIEDTSEADWDFSFDLNVKSMYRVTKALLPGLLERVPENGGSVILNMASMAGSIKGFPNRLLYGATKAAVIGFTKAMAADYVARGLRVNCLCPGTVDTPSLRSRIDSAPDPVAAEKAFIARQPMGRLATVDDIAPMVVMLLSDESRFVTGQPILVDGGVMI
jgi:2-keto-3-deoxy-L-fuconate dehydrogenase